jgi:signal transduction histidine kinase
VGLGLAIGHWITQAHGGTIRVESELNVGSQFTVQLPVA